MTESEIRHWAAEGFEFGSHTRTHASLPQASQAELIKEVVNSRDELQTLTGLPVLSFAYPFGFWNESVVNVMRGTYHAVLSTEQGFNTLTTDPHLLRRVSISAIDGIMSLKFQLITGKRLGYFLPERLKSLDSIRRLANQLP